MEDTFKKILFKEGDEVAHKDNLGCKLEVRKIVKKFKRTGNEKEPVKAFTLGIECGWWAGNAYNVELFNTNKLVPWDIAEGGYIEVARYLDRKNNIGIRTERDVIS